MKLLGTDEPGGYTPLEVCRCEVEALREERVTLLAKVAELAETLADAEDEVVRLRRTLGTVRHW